MKVKCFCWFYPLIFFLWRVHEVKSYCKEGLEHYQTLEKVFNTIATSSHLHFSSSQVLLSLDKDHDLEEIFLSHRDHIDINHDVYLIKPYFKSMIEKRPRQPNTPLNECGKKLINRSEYDSYFQMSSSMMNTRLEMVKCISAKTTS